MENNFIYITRSGRSSKKLIYNSNPVCSRPKKLKNRKMLRDEELIQQLQKEKDDAVDRLTALERERELENEKQRKEIERLRAELEEQRKQQVENLVERPRQPGATQEGQPLIHIDQQQSRNIASNTQVPDNVDIANSLGESNRNETANNFCAIIGNLQTMQLDVKPPKFSDEWKRNPLEFIEALEKFFKIKDVKENKKLIMAEHSLEGKAQIWINLNNNFISYSQFKLAFLNEFYSIPIRVKAKNTWANKKYCEYMNNTSLQTYFYMQMKEADYLIPKLLEYEKIFTIVQQLPVWVKESLAGVNFENANTVGQTLANLDAIQREKDNTHQNKQYNSHMQTARVRQTYVHNTRRGYNNNNSYNSYRYNSRGYTQRGRYRENNMHHNASYNSNYPVQNNSTPGLPDTRYPPPTIIPPTNSNTQNTNNLN